VENIIKYIIAIYFYTLFVPLQAKKPKTRIKPPSADRGTECPGIAIG
jgi:hypothetical protein